MCSGSPTIPSSGKRKQKGTDVLLLNVIVAVYFIVMTVGPVLLLVGVSIMDFVRDRGNRSSD
jgi:hypothetical protein